MARWDTSFATRPPRRHRRDTHIKERRPAGPRRGIVALLRSQHLTHMATLLGAGPVLEEVDDAT